MNSGTSDAERYERERKEANERYERERAADHEASELRRKESRRAHDERRKRKSEPTDPPLDEDQSSLGTTSEEDS